MILVVRLSIIILSLIIIAGCQEQLYHYQGNTMGTSWHLVSAQSVSDTTLHDVKQALAEVDNRMSTYKQDSDISKINRVSHTNPIPLHPSLQQVFRMAKQIYQQSNGYFDISVQPLITLWGFESSKQEIPRNQEITEYLKLVGDNAYSIQESSLIKNLAGVKFNLSAIAKGYAIDQAVQVLDAHQENYLLEVGGEVFARGYKRNSRKWRVAIEKPHPINREAYSRLEIIDSCVATSGNYRQFFYADGRIYSHIINPKTGYPVEHSTLSITVIANNCMRADAWATALMVLPYAQAIELANKNNIQVFILNNSQGKMKNHQSNAWKRYYD